MYASRRNKIFGRWDYNTFEAEFQWHTEAYFNGVLSRLIYMSLPPELELPKHFVYKNKLAVCTARVTQA